MSKGGTNMVNVNRSAVEAALIPVCAHSAVGRLREFKSHHRTLGRDLRDNWRGWTGSVVFHASLLLIFMAITWTIFSEQRDYLIHIAPINKPKVKADVSLNDIITGNMGAARVDTLPSTKGDLDTPSVGSLNLDDVSGVPPWVGHGRNKGRKGLGGEWGRGPGGIPGTPFWPYIKTINKLDIVFVFDSTGSMGGVITEVKARIGTFMKTITWLVPDTRLALVTYRDHRKYDLNDFEYTIRYTPLTDGTDKGIAKLRRFLRTTEAFGGGDIPEAVHEGLKTAIRNAGWRKNSKRIIIIFGDAPPRPENNGLARIYALSKAWHDKTGGVVCCIDTTGRSQVMDEFKEIAAGGGGRAGLLNSERDIVKQLMTYVFPKKYEDEAKKFWERFNREQQQDEIIRE